MNKLLPLLLGSALATLSVCAFATGTVVLNNQNHTEQQSIDNLATLSQLVTHPDLPQDIWWKGAVIAHQTATDKAEQDKRAVLARLTVCKADASPQQAAMLQSIIDQLKHIHVVDRLFTTLDPDEVRSINGADLPLEGEYQLYSRTQPSTLWVMGAINEPGPVTWQPATRVSDYLDSHDRLSGADRSVATLIQPNGKTTTVPVAYWNNLHREAEPGSIVWVGFSPCTENDAGKPLQDDIISLLTRRVPD